MKKISVAALFCTLIFAIGAFALQSSGTQPNSGQMGTPSGQSPQMPSQHTPLDQAAPPSQPGSQGPQARTSSNIDEQVKVLSDQLNLTPDQQSKVKTILMDQHQQAMTLIQDNSMPRETKVEKIHSLRSSTIEKVRQLLTADQKPKFDQMVQQQDERIRQRQQDSGNSPSSTSPSSSPSSAPSGAMPGSTSPNANPPSSTTMPGGNNPNSNPPSATKPPQ